MSIFDPLPRHKSPSRRYPQFITIYEKKVEEAQAMVRQAESMQRPYIVVAEVLESLNIPNDGDLSIAGDSLYANFTLLPTDSLKTFKKHAEKIGKALLDAELHESGTPCYGECSSWRQIYFDYGILRLTFDLPAEGLSDLEVIREIVLATMTRYRYIPRIEQEITKKVAKEIFDSVKDSFIVKLHPPF